MSIAPPSDIILDVAQAADPLQVQTATSRLAAKAAGADEQAAFGVALETAMRGRGPSPAALPLLQHAGVVPGPTLPGVEPRRAATDQKFEAMVLQSFIENILPKDADLFGDAASAEMSRSLFAERIAQGLAKSGRMGIARAMERRTAGAHEAPAAPLDLTARGPTRV